MCLLHTDTAHLFMCLLHTDTAHLFMCLFHTDTAHLFMCLFQSLLHALVKLKKNGKLKPFQTHLSQDCPECFETLSEDPSALEKFMKMKESLKSHQSHDYPECSEREQEDPEVLFIVEKMLETCGSERSLKITLHILRNMKQKDLADSLEREQHSKFSPIASVCPLCPVLT